MTILVIGSGISGLSSAIEGANNGAKVILVSPFHSERSQSVMAAGGINAAIKTENDYDSWELHGKETIKSGCFLENEKDIYEFTKNAPSIIKWLEDSGVVFSREENGSVATRAFGGQSRKRTCFSGSSTGKQIVTGLVQKARELELQGKIERKFGLWFVSAIIKDGTCYGGTFSVWGSQELVNIYADGIIVATGGQNAIFGKTTGSTLCDGYVAGRLFEQGVKLKNLEFIQYHPTTIDTGLKKMLITEAARGEGGRLFYLENGRKVYFMEDKYGEKGNLMPRDIVSREIYNTHKKVYLDITFLGGNLIHKKLREVYDLCEDFLGLDVTKEPIPVSPGIHYFMGGIYVNETHETSIKNLYAVGECASKYHGANRLGGNSLLAAVYSGRVAASTICKAGERDYSEVSSYFDQHKDELIPSVEKEIEEYSVMSKSSVEGELSKIMNETMAIVRDYEILAKGLKEIEKLEKENEKTKFSESLNYYENVRVEKMILLGKVAIMCASARKESRGAHFRSDYQETLPEYRKSTIAELKEGKIVISFLKEAEEADL